MLNTINGIKTSSIIKYKKWSHLSGLWKATLPNACMYNRNTGYKTGITSMADCQSECESASVVCLAVDLNIDTLNCYFNDADSSIQAVKSPCSTSYQYSEKGQGLFYFVLFGLFMIITQPRIASSF